MPPRLLIFVVSLNPNLKFCVWKVEVDIGPNRWFVVVGQKDKGGPAAMREGSALDSKPVGAAPEGSILRISRMLELDNKKMRAKCVEPMEGWLGTAFIECMFGGCWPCK